MRNTLAERKYHPVIVDNFDDLKTELTVRQYDSLILDCTQYLQETLSLIHYARDELFIFSMHIYISSPRPSKQYALDLIKAGIDGFIVKPFSDEKFDTIFSKINSEAFSNNRRRFIRIKPKRDEKAEAHIVSPYNGESIPLRIVNLSLGGIAAIPAKSENLELPFKVNDVIRNCKLYLNNSLLTAKAMVIVMIQGRIGFKFLDLEENSRNILCNYIFDNITFEEEEF